MFGLDGDCSAAVGRAAVAEGAGVGEAVHAAGAVDAATGRVGAGEVGISVEVGERAVGVGEAHAASRTSESKRRDERKDVRMVRFSIGSVFNQSLTRSWPFIRTTTYGFQVERT